MLKNTSNILDDTSFMSPTSNTSSRFSDTSLHLSDFEIPSDNDIVNTDKNNEPILGGGKKKKTATKKEENSD